MQQQRMACYQQPTCHHRMSFLLLQRFDLTQGGTDSLPQLWTVLCPRGSLKLEGVAMFALRNLVSSSGPMPRKKHSMKDTARNTASHVNDVNFLAFGAKMLDVLCIVYDTK